MIWFPASRIMAATSSGFVSDMRQLPLNDFTNRLLYVEAFQIAISSGRFDVQDSRNNFRA